MARFPKHFPDPNNPPADPSDPAGAHPDTLSDDAARVLTWSALLALWTDFAKAAAAAPPDLDAGRWKAAAPPIIALQAVAFALSDLPRLPPTERPLALDRAELTIRTNTDTLRSLWHNAPLPASLQELIYDAETALHAARKG